MSHQPDRKNPRRGNVMVEFGLAFPLLFVVLSGMFEFGYAFFLYNELQSAVRTGARYAATADFDAPQNGNSFKSRVQNVVAYGVPGGGSTPVVKGLTASKVTVSWLADGAGIPQTVTVRVSAFTFYAVFGTFTLSNKPYATFIYLGQWVN